MSKRGKWLVGAGAAAALSAFGHGQTMAQTPRADQAAEVTKAKLAKQDANEKLAWAYYKPGNTIDERLAFISPSFVNHSAEIVRFMELNHIQSAKDAFRAMVETRAKLIGDPNTGTNPPTSQPFKVMASGDLVTVVHERHLPDPTKPGQSYTLYQFDMFRVQDGKFVEHWDGTPLPQPLPTLLAEPISQMHFPNQTK
jgi:predicted SnoaL-like aldol condensation-catalyzing enzyme